jgi:hypothetical protein
VSKLPILDRRSLAILASLILLWWGLVFASQGVWSAWSQALQGSNPASNQQPLAEVSAWLTPRPQVQSTRTDPFRSTPFVQAPQIPQPKPRLNSASPKSPSPKSSSAQMSVAVSPKPNFSLQSVFWGGSPVALLQLSAGTQLAKQGETIQGWTILQIHKSKIILQQGSTQVTLSVP